jgi:hypothetical protein
VVVQQYNYIIALPLPDCIHCNYIDALPLPTSKQTTMMGVAFSISEVVYCLTFVTGGAPDTHADQWQRPSIAKVFGALMLISLNATIIIS